MRADGNVSEVGKQHAGTSSLSSHRTFSGHAAVHDVCGNRCVSSHRGIRATYRSRTEGCGARFACRGVLAQVWKSCAWPVKEIHRPPVHSSGTSCDVGIAWSRHSPQCPANTRIQHPLSLDRRTSRALGRRDKNPVGGRQLPSYSGFSSRFPPRNILHGSYYELLLRPGWET